MIRTFVFSIILVTLTLHIGSTQGQGKWNCTSSTGDRGVCIPIQQCTPLLTLLEQQHQHQRTRDFIREQQCGFYDQVCCVIATGGASQISPNIGPSLAASSEISQLNQNDVSDLLPSDCGKDLSSRIIGGERTEIDEFPWMALLEYRTSFVIKTSCGGALISRRYVLTAAHCVKRDSLPEGIELISVRLGEYDTNTEIDCVKDGENSQICADYVVRVPIEEQITHEQYVSSRKTQLYDIALLRLSRDVPFTKYIKPICLPTMSTISEILFVAGWGKTENSSSSNIKLKVSLPLFDKTKCTTVYQFNQPFGQGQFCAGGKQNKDSCKGDSGGPLMSVERSADGVGKWTIAGIVSIGPNNCGSAGLPGVYTKVYDYKAWILSKMRR